MLIIENLYVHYGRVAAVQGISLRVEHGEIVGLIGPNGAGKSTTLMTIAGVVPPKSGNIMFEGESLVGLPPEQIVRRGMALVPEGRRIFGSLTVGENLRLGTTTLGRRRANQAAGDRVLGYFPMLKPYLGAPAGRLSGGEQQQLAIARALLSEPRLLLLDEPSLGLAPLLVDLLFSVLDRLRTERTTILLVEQNAVRTVKLADRTYVMGTGQIRLEGTRDELLRVGELETAYLGLRKGSDQRDE
jgi:branched-chain amino acid transport system ATP-binding protein